MDHLAGSQFNDTKILLYDEITLSKDDLINTVASCQIFRDLPPVSGPRIIISRNIFTQPTNSQAIGQSSPRHTQTPIRHRLPSTLETNRTRNICIALLSSLDSISPPTPIGNLFNPSTSTIDNYETATPCVERIVHGLTLNLSPEHPPALQNILTQHKIEYFRSFNAAFDLDDTLESNGNVNFNRSLILSPAKKTKKFEVLQNPDLEAQFADRVCFAGFYFLPIPFFCPEIKYTTFAASFVCSRLKFDCDPSGISVHGTTTF